MLSLIQERLEGRLSLSTLKVYMATIVVYYDTVEGKSYEKHNLIVRFLRGAKSLNPPRP